MIQSSIEPLLRGESETILGWARTVTARRVAGQAAVVVLGTFFYGASIGWWRSGEQAVYTGIKLPLILLSVAAGNALLNAMLAPLLGLNLGLRQTFAVILMSISISAAVLGAFSPLFAFVIWNAPPLAGGRAGLAIYDWILLLNVVAIALAGIAGHVRLYRLLADFGASRAVARRVLVAWLAGNLLLGAQLSWILRPFIGFPTIPVQFLRPDAFHGNFFETVFQTTQRVLH